MIGDARPAMRSGERPHPLVRRCAVVSGALSALLLGVAVPLALVSPMALDAGGGVIDHLLVYALLVGPLLLLASAIAGYLSHRRSSVARAVAAVLPLVVWLAVVKLVQL